MKIYIDLVLFINFLYDFIILLTINILYKRNSKIYKIIISSLIGSLSIFLMFINTNEFIFMFLKILIIIVMMYISYGFNNLKFIVENIITYYIISFILGGNLEYLSSKFGSSDVKITFLILLSPIILIIYIRQIKSLKIEISMLKKVRIFLNNKVIELNGYIDTGNNLSSYIGNKMVFISNNLKVKKELNYNPIYIVPFNTINSTGIIKCIKPKYVEVEEYGKFNNILIGYMDKKFSLENAQVILNKKILEGK